MTENIPSLNLVDVVSALQKRWKLIVAFVLAVFVIACIIVFFIQPKYYKSSSTIIAANPELADKGRLFNNNLQKLYSNFGTADDLDRLYAMFKSDVVYGGVVKEFDLAVYYNIDADKPAIIEGKVLRKLKDDVEIEKTELNELKITCITRDAKLSAAIINSLVANVQAKVEEMWEDTFANTISNLDSSEQKLAIEYDNLSRIEFPPSASKSSIKFITAKKDQLLEQLTLLNKIRNEYKIAYDSKSPALIVLEKAYPSALEYRHKKGSIILTALLSSFVFGCLVVLAYDRKPAP